MLTKRDAIKELFGRLDQLPAASSREEAHRLLRITLDQIETERRKCTYDEDYKVLGTERLTVWSLEAPFWEDLDKEIAWMTKGLRTRTELHRDGTIKVLKQTIGGDWMLTYHKPGASFSCQNGHWLTDKFDPEAMGDVDQDYLWLAIRASRVYGEVYSCAFCRDHADRWERHLVWSRRVNQYCN